MSGRELFHGGAPGLRVGAWLVPSPPRVTDGCPVCVARSEGRVYTVGEFRRWQESFGDEARRALEAVEGAPDSAPLDPPSSVEGVYVTSHRGYATWYAARSRGDLYLVRPGGEMPVLPSATDLFPTWIVARAQVAAVIERGVRLSRRQRRDLSREWGKRETTQVPA